LNWVLDLDGVIWRGDDPIPGSADAVAKLRAAGHRVCFVTNNSSLARGEVLAKLERCGFPARADELITSAQAAAHLVEPGSTALVCAGPGVVEALEERDVRVIADGPADAVVVGFHREFDYGRMEAAFRSVRGGARLIGTNDDATYPVADGDQIPGGGAILASVAYASGVEPQVAGKPFEAAADLVKERMGDVDVMVGDRPSTDGRFAVALGARFALVLSGVTDTAEGSDPPADMVGDDLAEVVRAALARASGSAASG
jgi:4-nitrophenyl phosphatase